jgi:geranylgeranyl pyrophosphate synthase
MERCGVATDATTIVEERTMQAFNALYTLAPSDARDGLEMLARSLMSRTH